MKKYERFELALQGPEMGNPFRDVELEAVFMKDTTEIVVPGFYDGDGIYRIRFMPKEEGKWTYATKSNIEELDGKRGELLCEGVSGHGPVRVKDTCHFCYDDGTIFYPFGTTAYAWTSQKPEIIEQTFVSLAKAPFNKIRMSPLPKHYILNFNDPDMYPFEGGRNAEFREVPPAFTGSDGKGYTFDFSRPNVKYWQHFDRIMDRLEEMGIICDFIFFHSYDRWGFSQMPQEDNLGYVKYACARYAAYSNIWWSMANEWDLIRNWTEEKWEELAAAVVKYDHVGHLRSIHNGGRMYDQKKEWITHASIQKMPFMVEESTRLRHEFNKPVVWDEVGYEGNIDETFGDLPAEELVRRSWVAVMNGTYCTHGECFENEDDIIFWAKGGTLVGKSVERIAFLKQLLETAPGPVDAQEGFILGYCGMVAGERFKAPYNPFPQDPNFQPQELEFGDWLLYYIGYEQPASRTFILPEDKKYTLEVIDTWNMTIEKLEGEFSGRFRIRLPQRPYMAVRCTLVK